MKTIRTNVRYYVTEKDNQFLVYNENGLSHFTVITSDGKLYELDALEQGTYHSEDKVVEIYEGIWELMKIKHEKLLASAIWKNLDTGQDMV